MECLPKTQVLHVSFLPLYDSFVGRISHEYFYFLLSANILREFYSFYIFGIRDQFTIVVSLFPFTFCRANLVSYLDVIFYINFARYLSVFKGYLLLFYIYITFFSTML